MKKSLSLLGLCISLSFSPPASAADLTVEWAPFLVAEGVADAELVAASKDMQKRFLEKQSGFLRRDLLHEGGRKWVDIVYWASSADAEKAMQAAQSSQFCRAYFSLMEAADQSDPGAGVLHLRVVDSWPNDDE